MQGYSVRFDEAAKAKIRHHLEQVRGIIDKLEVDDRRREDLYSRLNELIEEVDRDRTHFDRLAAFSIAVGSVSGQTIEKSKVLEILDKVAQIFSSAWGHEPKQLPAPPKRIEPPRAPSPTKKKKDDFDDEIPF